MRNTTTCALWTIQGLLALIFLIRTDLTPLAARGLVIIMVGAVSTTVATVDASLAILPLVVGVLAEAVAYGRTRLAPLTDRRANRAALHPAS